VYLASQVTICEERELEVPVDFIGTGTGAGMLQGRIEGSEMGAANGNWRTWRTLVYNVLEGEEMASTLNR
jgi:hypothetical protein